VRSTCAAALSSLDFFGGEILGQAGLLARAAARVDDVHSRRDAGVVQQSRGKRAQHAALFREPPLFFIGMAQHVR
jgi:hypothetical protein